MESGRRIFTENEHGQLIPMRVAAPPSEDELQDLIARFPEIVSEHDGELLLIRREQGVPGQEAGSDRWSLDHLFVSQKAVPVLIEVKRASDTRIRREVIGQILDYAANGVAYWPKGALKAAFVRTCEESGKDPDMALSEFLGTEDPTDFWDQAEANLEAGRVKLVVAADSIPSELARVIEFLNEQMRAEVRAVELRYFLGEDGRRTLAPRIFGETEKTRATKSAAGRAKLDPISVEAWLEKFTNARGNDADTGARSHLDIIARIGGETVVTSTQGSLAARFQGKDGKLIYPLSLWNNGTVTINFAWTCDRPQLADDNVRQHLLDRFNEAVGGLSTKNLKGFPAFPAASLVDGAIRESYETVARDFVALAVADGSES
ncbi:MAG: hypothetical protein KDC18_03235 [Alphaproteobacteria bacterium]|nr:hypothetical protein [Alphaproteobacteria bacterium]